MYLRFGASEPPMIFPSVNRAAGLLKLGLAIAKLTIESRIKVFIFKV